MVRALLNFQKYSLQRNTRGTTSERGAIILGLSRYTMYYRAVPRAIQIFEAQRKIADEHVSASSHDGQQLCDFLVSHIRRNQFRRNPSPCAVTIHHNSDLQHKLKESLRKETTMTGRLAWLLLSLCAAVASAWTSRAPPSPRARWAPLLQSSIITESSYATTKRVYKPAQLKQQKKGNRLLSFKKKFDKLGLSTVLAYYFVSHINSAVTLTLSWYIHAAKVRWGRDMAYFILRLAHESHTDSRLF